MRRAAAKTGLVPVMFVVAALAGGVLGMVRHLISYSISPGYFRELLFERQRIPFGTPERLGATIVGWREGRRMGAWAAAPILGSSLGAPGRWRERSSWVRLRPRSRRASLDTWARWLPSPG